MKEALKNTSYAQYLGRGSGALCQIKTETQKQAGDKVTFGLRMQLTGDGRVGDEILEGNEEALAVYSDSVVINRSRHAVRSAGKMSEQRVDFSVREEGRDALADWFSNLMDTAFFNQLAGNTVETRSSFIGHNSVTAPDSDHWLYASNHTAEASLSATTIMTLPLIDYAVEKAKTAVVPMRPIKVGGGDSYYVLFLHPYHITQLRTNTSSGQWLDIQKAAATAQGQDNAIFRGGVGIYNGVILKESTRLPEGAVTAVAGKNARRAVFCGAQAMVSAFGQGYGDASFDWNEELFDYGSSLGIAVDAMFGIKRTIFNGSAIGAITISTWGQPAV